LPACALALGATAVVENVRSRRAIVAMDYFCGLYETALAPDELFAEVQIPVQSRSCLSVLMEWHVGTAILLILTALAKI
jgi:CO/xanthine dehydrogenase FAD-binding subunit